MRKSLRILRTPIGVGCAIVFAIHLALASIAWLVIGSFISRTNEDVERRLYQAREAGEPVTIAELYTTLPNPAAEDNAEAPLQMAFEAFRLLPDPYTPIPYWYYGEGTELPVGAQIPADMRAAITNMLELNNACFPLIDEALAKPAFRYPLDFKQGIDLDLPHLGRLRDLARLLALKALLAADRNDVGEAYTNLLAGLRFSELLRDEPILISQAVRIALHLTFSRALEDALLRVDFSEEQMRTLQSEVASAHDSDMEYRALLGERCLTLHVYDDLDAGISPSFFEANSLARLSKLLPGRTAYDKNTYMESMATALLASKQPFPQKLSAMRKVRGTLRDPKEFSPGSFYTMLADLSLPGSLNFSVAHGRYEAALSLEEIVLSSKRFQIAHGRLPHGVNELVTEYLDTIPIDPFDGSPLRYNLEKRIVYSVGDDQIDNGGKKSKNSNRPWNDGDYRFQLERAPHEEI